MRYFEDLRPGHTETIAAEYELTEAGIIAFAREWDPQPFHIDPEHARQTPMGGLTASRPDRGLVTVDSALRSRKGKVVLQLQSLMMIFRRPKNSE